MKVFFNRITQDIEKTVCETFEKNKSLMEELVEGKSENDLLEIQREVDSGLWDTDKLENFISPEIALTLSFYIEKVVGQYKVLKYWHLVVNKGRYGMCRNEEEFNQWALEKVFNLLHPSMLKD